MPKRLPINLSTVILICVSMMFALPTARADTWSELDVRNIKPGMTYAEVDALVTKEWPNAQIKRREKRISAAGETYDYGSLIEIRQRTDQEVDRITITFLPAKTITADATSSTVKRIRRNASFPKRPVGQDRFITQLKQKYGTPTFEKVGDLTWIFTADEKLLSKERNTELYDAKQAECSEIDKEWREARRRQYQDSGAITPIDDLRVKLRTCQSELSRINTCFANMDLDLCPYRLRYTWTTRRENAGFVLGFSVDQIGLTTDQTEREHMDAIRDQLREKARTAIEENADGSRLPKL